METLFNSSKSDEAKIKQIDNWYEIFKVFEEYNNMYEPYASDLYPMSHLVKRAFEIRQKIIKSTP